MRGPPVRAPADWLTLREPADAAARSTELIAELLPHLCFDVPVTIHDLGCGTGSMARWLAPQLPGPQHWVLHDRDEDLLARVAAPAPHPDRYPVTCETRRDDVTRLDPDELAAASLITASALLDMMTADELGRLVASCASPRCPVLITLSVTGHVELTPGDPLDRRVAEAFDDHQRRDPGVGALLGPDAVAAAVDAFGRRGFVVAVRPSPWQLGRAERGLAAAWFTGWLAAACEQQPSLSGLASSYGRRRIAEATDGRLSVTVHHEDLLALPR